MLDVKYVIGLMIGIMLINFTCDSSGKDRGWARTRWRVWVRVFDKTGSAAVKPCLSFLLCHCCQANRKTFVFVLELTAYKVLDKPEQVSRPQGPQELLRHCAVHTAHQSYSTFLTSCKTSFTKSGRFTSNTRDEIYDKVLSKNNVNYCMHWSFINTNAGVSMSVV